MTIDYYTYLIKIDWKINCMVIEIRLKSTPRVTIPSLFSHQSVIIRSIEMSNFILWTFRTFISSLNVVFILRRWSNSQFYPNFSYNCKSTNHSKTNLLWKIISKLISTY